ncbi:MAG: cation transporter [Verrucomicrobia bacterium]|nr:cation transporter [Verrucomicrobiota bacterium]
MRTAGAFGTPGSGLPPEALLRIYLERLGNWPEIRVIAASIVIAVTGWTWLDPAVSLTIAALIVVSTWGLLRDSVNLSMDAVPPEIDPREVQALLSRLLGVREVHDLHVWAMSTTETALTAHLVVPDYQGQEELLRQAVQGLHEAFEIRHVTLQVERGEQRCPLADEGTI